MSAALNEPERDAFLVEPHAAVLGIPQPAFAAAWEEGRVLTIVRPLARPRRSLNLHAVRLNTSRRRLREEAIWSCRRYDACRRSPCRTSQRHRHLPLHRHRGQYRTVGAGPGSHAGAVERQLAILQSLITAHHGVLYKTIGDGTQAAFGTAEDALRAALASQRALLAEAWGELGPIRVRMALHAGEAIPDAYGDYLAAPLNRLSRLVAAGHGGQILLAQTVQQLTRGALPAGAELRDLGEHRLRDLLEPEHVFQLVHPDLPSDFPPLRSLDARPQNLPRQPTPFLGREQQVAEVVDLLRRDDTQLLTLVGPGGTGKTRLALQVAAEVLDDFADGVFFVPLAPLTDPALVPSAIATALGLREEGEQSLASRLHDFLATREVLLVLDNFEHLVDGGPAVWTLLGSAPRVTVLATSRVPLHLRAEREYPVPPLGLPRRTPPPTLEQLSQYEAVRLFIDRAQAVNPDFAVDNDNAPAVAEICWRLDGLPLAIELAAARVRLLPPQAILARLEHRLPFLTGGARDAPERQQTLRNTIAWSYDLLESDEQKSSAAWRSSPGAAHWSRPRRSPTWTVELDVFSGVEPLVEQSLLRQEAGADGAPRFTMLETIREFGLEQLEASGEADAARARHAAVVLALAEEADAALHGPQQLIWIERLETEYANIRSALGWALTANQRRPWVWWPPCTGSGSTAGISPKVAIGQNGCWPPASQQPRRCRRGYSTGPVNSLSGDKPITPPRPRVPKRRWPWRGRWTTGRARGGPCRTSAPSPAVLAISNGQRRSVRRPKHGSAALASVMGSLRPCTTRRAW